MIYSIFILLVAIILITTLVTLNMHHGKITERPLRKKIAEDTANTLLFITIFFCSFLFSDPELIIVSVIFMIFVVLLYRYKDYFKLIIKRFLDKIRLKIAFSASIKRGIQRDMKNWEKVGNYPRNSPPRAEIYREYILLIIVLFCKRTVLCIIVLFAVGWSLQSFSGDRTVLNVIEQFARYREFLIFAMILLNNMGFVFNCWKFNSDYQAIRNEKYDEQLDRVIRRLERREHDI